jgi:3-hydroxyacyl-[acyl-carrier-protein] dehydratase
MTELILAIDAQHPAFEGHFPSHPIVPGVVLLDHSLRAIDAHRHGHANGVACRLGSVKFLSMVGPGELLRLEFEATGDDSVRLRVYAGERNAERLAMNAAVTYRTMVELVASTSDETH